MQNLQLAYERVHELHQRFSQVSTVHKASGSDNFITLHNLICSDGAKGGNTLCAKENGGRHHLIWGGYGCVLCLDRAIRGGGKVIQNSEETNHTKRRQLRTPNNIISIVKLVAYFFKFLEIQNVIF
ncbi:hypothetical protein VNO78_20385 [Psophocarpus tetragonolobus]|uniref:Uncharacterized protein n=1 Tax=Psophocarpus tetragonolobus TaxID=3891 RepID=A0AAN9XH38_PSOTE